MGTTKITGETADQPGLLRQAWDAWRRSRERRQLRRREAADRAERARIAKVFNDRYTYREQWIRGQERLEGTGPHGITPRRGYAWMCPECNQVHHPERSSVMSGLQYPGCCSSAAGHRLDHGIQLPKET